MILQHIAGVLFGFLLGMSFIRQEVTYNVY